MPSRTVAFFASLALVSSLPSVALASNVLTVGGTGGDFPDIASAVAAAAEGDVILVRSGSYSGFQIQSKALSVVADADAGATVDVTSRVSVTNLSSSQKAVLAGLHIVAPGTGASECFLANGNQGSVRLQSCEIGRMYMQRGVGTRLLGCPDIAFVGCTVQGARGYYVDPHTGQHFGGGDGFRGLWSSTSQIALYDCDIRGGPGEPGASGNGYPGGDGAEACFLDGVNFLFASGTAFDGGDGGDGASAADCFDKPAGEGGDGSDGIRDAGSAHIVLMDCTLTAGAAGRAGHEGCGSPPDDGVPGFEIVLGAGSTLDELPGSARRLVMPTPVREGAPIQLTFTGEPGEAAYLTMWGDTRFLYSPGYSGVLLERNPLVRRIRLGIVPAGGVLQVQIALPELGAGVEGRNYFFQGYFLGPGATVTLASPAFVSVLDSSF